MTTWKRFVSWVRAVMRRSRMERDMDAELAFHIEALAEDLVRGGVPREEALRRARIEFGGIERVKEEAREARGVSFFDGLTQDFQYAVRTLRKSPGFTAVAVLTLALGIAVNATMFSMVSAFLLRRPPGREPNRVVVISGVNPAQGFQSDLNGVSAPNYMAWREANHVFEEVAAADEYRTVSLTAQGTDANGQITSMGKPEALRASAVTFNYFRVLGVSTQFGRTFAEGEDQPGHEHVVILGHELWERRFGSDISVIGRTIRLNRENYTVIGVMPANFRLLGFIPQLWTPLVLGAADQTEAARKDRSLNLYARLKPGVTVEQARAEMATLGRRAEENFPAIEKGWGVGVRTLPEYLIENFSVRGGLAVFMTTVGFVLLIACANVAGLLLARAAGRRKELAIRISLGAGRLRIVRQMLTEGLVIAFLGGGLGLLASYWGINFVRANMNFNEYISAVSISLDWNVVFFVLAISVASAVLCGLIPALNASRTDVNTNLKEEGRSSSASRSHSRMRTVMVTAEIALALFLLVGTGLLIRRLSVLHNQSLGFLPDHVLTAGLTLDSAQYKDASQQTSFVRNVLLRLQQVPGAEAVAVTSDLPATGPGKVTFLLKGQSELPANQRPNTLDFVITPEFFQAAGLPLLRGRVLTERDDATAPRVVLVNQEFVRRHLQGQEPLGKQIRLDLSGGTPEWSEIVGVVGNTKSYSGSIREEPQVFEAMLQRPVPSFSLMIRAGSDPDSLAAAMRNAMAQVDAELPLVQVMSMSAVIERQNGSDTIFEELLGSFALLALILAAIGIYGLVAYSVGQRTHEIGIRMALGAEKPHVLRMVLRDGLKMTAIGASIGLLMALPLPKILEAVLYFGGENIREPFIYFVVPMAIGVVTMLATYIPARRAMRVDPIVALRYE
ncbi:MAG TPA: ABC transporter permease [Candidatus Acidoferrum sp.]|nr:ABC transporter permease [Candidatus Acidoferrum sp.]